MKDSILSWIQGWACKEQDYTIGLLRQEIAALETQNVILREQQDSLLSEIGELEKDLELYRLINAPDEDEELREYWEFKRPKTNDFRYAARAAQYGGPRILMDPRVFFTPIDDAIPIVHGDTNDEKAYNALRRVVFNVRYKTDQELYGATEHWPFAYETLHLRQGDCDGGAILMANIMLKSGVPEWRIRLCAGSVKGGGHAWVTYLRESDDKWVILDWCYWPQDSLSGLLWKDAENYFRIWFSWNNTDIYANDFLDRRNE